MYRRAPAHRQTPTRPDLLPAQVMLDGVIHIPARLFTRDDWFGFHPRARRWMRSRNVLKYAVSAGVVGDDAPPLQQQVTQLQSILILFMNEFTNVFTARAITTLGHLIIHKRLQRIGKGNIHCAHDPMLVILAKFGKNFIWG